MSGAVVLSNEISIGCKAIGSRLGFVRCLVELADMRHLCEMKSCESRLREDYAEMGVALPFAFWHLRVGESCLGTHEITSDVAIE